MLSPRLNINSFARTLQSAALMLLPLILALPAPALASVQQADMIGEAFDPERRTLLYREFHRFSDDGQTHRVEYRSENDSLLLAKALTGGRTTTKPEFRQADIRSGEVLLVQRNGGQWRFSRGKAGIEILEQGAANSAAFDVSSEVKLKDSKGLVLDAGFDAFVRNNWEQLVGGESLQFDFAVPARASTVKMRIAQVDGKRCVQQTDYPADMTQPLPVSGNYACFRLAVSNWVVRLLLKPIYLTYDADARQLMAYKGMSNLKGDDGQAQNVYIRYRYASAAR